MHLRRKITILFARALLAAAGAALVFFASRAAAAPDQKSRPSPRRRSHHAREKAGKERRAKKGERRAAPRRLAEGRWRPEVAQALEALLAERGKGSPGYDPRDPPVAAMVFDDAAITHNVGEAIFSRMVSGAEFGFKESFWELVPIQFGKARIRAGWEGFRELPRSSWPRDPHYLMYRKGFLRCYQSLCREFGAARCSGWLVKLLSGFREAEIRDYIRAAIEEELKAPVGEESVGEGGEDADPVRVRTGLRFIPEMQDLFARLKEEGFDVWVLSSSNHWAVEAMSEEYGVHPSRVLGIRPKVLEDGVSSELLIPLTQGTGNAEAVSMFIGRSPALILGAEADEPLMRYGRGLRIQIVEASRLGVPSERRPWLLQPRFSPVRAPQKRSVAAPAEAPPEPAVEPTTQ